MLIHYNNLIRKTCVFSLSNSLYGSVDRNLSMNPLSQELDLAIDCKSNILDELSFQAIELAFFSFQLRNFLNQVEHYPNHSQVNL